MILGHEVAGTVTALGEGVTDLEIGDLVAVSPSRPCGRCRYCAEGLPNHCEDMRFYGSAMPFPPHPGCVSRSSQRGCRPVRQGQRIDAGRGGDGRTAFGGTARHAARRRDARQVRPRDRLRPDRLPGRACGTAGRSGGNRRDRSFRQRPCLRRESRRRPGDQHRIGTGCDETDFAAGKGTFDVLYECSGAQAALGRRPFSHAAPRRGAAAPASVAT